MTKQVEGLKHRWESNKEKMRLVWWYVVCVIRTVDLYDWRTKGCCTYDWFRGIRKYLVIFRLIKKLYDQGI